MRQQSLVQELGGGSEVRGDVGVGEVVHLDAHVLDVHAGVEGLAGVDPGAVGGVQDVGDAHSLQASFVDGNRSEERKPETFQTQTQFNSTSPHWSFQPSHMGLLQQMDFGAVLLEAKMLRTFSVSGFSDHVIWLKGSRQERGRNEESLRKR